MYIFSREETVKAKGNFCFEANDRFLVSIFNKSIPVTLNRVHTDFNKINYKYS